MLPRRYADKCLMLTHMSTRCMHVLKNTDFYCLSSKIGFIVNMRFLFSVETVTEKLRKGGEICASNANHYISEPYKIKINVEISITTCNYAFSESFWQHCTKKWMLSLRLTWHCSSLHLRNSFATMNYMVSDTVQFGI